MDYFALGGILVQKHEVDVIFEAHKALCGRWRINYPLHSTKIRGRRENFRWLRDDKEREAAFLADLEAVILSLPIITIAAVVDRSGYVARYRERYAKQTWLMCKTAFAILVERAAKFVQTRDSLLEIYFEPSGKSEDASIKNYGRMLKVEGMPFDQAMSAAYGALQAEDFRAIILGEPRERTKATPMMQIADLVLYPMCKAGYDPDYGPYRQLFTHGKVIDALLTDADRPSGGIKYSCFTAHKQQDPAFAGS